MILVAGGQLDPNIGAFLRQCLLRRINFHDILVGPGLCPRVLIELDGRLKVDGRWLKPEACFIRHDVFCQQKTGSAEDARSALNWFSLIKDWAYSEPAIRMLNRSARSSDLGKLGMLRLASKFGLATPRTILTNDPSLSIFEDAIRKPVAGGELTRSSVATDQVLPHPYFIQERLRRPELRIYKVGDRLFAYSITCPDVDYREKHNATILPFDVPPCLYRPLIDYCEELNLDFAAADFMQGIGGDWVFLEVNSQPMFAAFDEISKGAISGAVIEWLVGQ